MLSTWKYLSLKLCRKVWPNTKIMLCLWHVRKAWVEDVVKKVSDPMLKVEVLKGIANVMYTTNGSKGSNVVAQAQQKFEDLMM